VVDTNKQTTNKQIKSSKSKIAMSLYHLGEPKREPQARARAGIKVLGLEPSFLKVKADRVRIKPKDVSWETSRALKFPVPKGRLENWAKLGSLGRRSSRLKGLERG